MANRLKKILKPILDKECKEAFKRGFEEGKQAGWDERVLAYENEIKCLKILLGLPTKEKNMKVDVRKLYSDVKEDYFYIGDYQPMVDAFGNVAVQQDIGSYQGDTLVLYDNGGRIGFLVFGWGSCSCCDALQACNNMVEVQELCDELQQSIKWFANKEEALKWAKEKDWAGEWFLYEEEGNEFVQKVIEYLSN